MKKIFVYAMLLGIIKFLFGCTGTAFYPYGFSVHGNKVFYKKPFPQGTIEVEGADARTFKVMGNEDDSTIMDSYYYGVDKNSVFYCGYQIPGGDWPSLKLLQTNYAKDKGQCYYTGTALPDADPASFVIKNDHFSADKNHIYHREMVLDNDASIFETFDSSSVVHTANTVSVYDKVIQLPAGAEFKFLAYNYYALNGQVFRWNDSLPGASAKDFIALTEWTSKTNELVYYSEKIIKGADPRTFKLLASPYSRDAKHIFFFERMIENADVATFEVINDKFQCARDKHALYHEGKKITDYTAEDFANKKACIKCNENKIYFAE